MEETLPASDRCSTIRRLLLVLCFFSSLAPALARAADTDADGVTDSAEIIDGTDPNDPDSFIEHSGLTYCLDWNGFLGDWQQIAELRNAGCSSLGLYVELRDSLGGVRDFRTLNISPSQQADLVLNDLAGFAPSVYGTLCASITSGDPDSLDALSSSYSLDGIGSFRAGYSMPSVPGRTGKQYLGYNRFFPTRDISESGNFVATYVRIANDEPTTELGTLIVYDAEGIEIDRLSDISVLGRGRVDAALNAVLPNTVGLIEWSPAAPDKKFRLTIDRYYFESASPFSGYRTILAIPARKGSGHAAASPFDTQSRMVVLELGNTLSTDVAVPVSLYDSAGAPSASQPGTISIPPKGTRHLVLNDYIPEKLGNVALGTTTSGSVVASLVEYIFALPGSRLSSANAGTMNPGFGSFQSSSYNHFLGGCRLRVSNLGSSSASAAIQVRRSDGTALSVPTPLAVPGHGAAELDVCEREPLRAAYGEVRVTPGTTESIVGEMVRTNNRAIAELRTPLLSRSICTANISVTPSLSLTASNNAPAAGFLTVTNNSAAVTATNVTATLPAGWTDVTQDASSCASIPPNGSCQISLTPGAAAHASASILVTGDSSPEALASVSVSPAPPAVISVSASSVQLFTNGSTRSLTVTNLSPTERAVNVASDLSGTALDGNATETGNTCANLLPAQSCTLTFTPGGTAVSATSFPIAGTNTPTATVTGSILGVGSSGLGGVVACLNGGFQDFVTASADNSIGASWGGIGVVTGAASFTDGATNTVSIVNTLGAASAAFICDAYEIDALGNTPCQPGETCFSDWFLPARDQLNCLRTNRVAVGGGFGIAYWSSTESNANFSWVQIFSNGAQSAVGKTNSFSVRCVRAVSP